MTISTLRLLRKERRWTLETLAERAGLTKSYLSKIERGHSMPSIAVAIQLADALQVDVADLFDDADKGADIAVYRSSGERKMHDPFDGSRYTAVAGSVANKQMLPFLIYPSRRAEQCAFREHVGDEFVVVVSGTVELSFPGRVETLSAGESAYFRGGIPHRFRSPGTDLAEVLIVIAASGVD